MFKTSRISIPNKPIELVKLAQDMEAQHLELGKDSPLTMLDWKATSPEIKEANDINNQVATLEKQLGILVERRNTLMVELGEFVRQGRDILSGVYRSEMKKLGDFGFEVLDSSPSRPKKTVKEEKPA